MSLMAQARRPATLLAFSMAVTACSDSEAVDDTAVTANETAQVIPDRLAPFGDGYPASGDPCRRLGESDATRNYLDDRAILIGCPDEASARAIGGRIVGNLEGVRLISIPMGDADIGMVENGPAAAGNDALVAGTEYNATTTLPCDFGGAAPTQTCEAGAKRNWGEDGTNLVEVTKPDGRKRAIFFNGTEPYSADSAQSDGSAGWDFETQRDGDRVTITYGPETYVVVDALITGG